MLQVLNACYYKLSNLKYKEVCPKLIAARIITHRDEQIIMQTKIDSEVAQIILDKIASSLSTGVPLLFEAFLEILEQDHDLCFNELADEMRKELSNNTTKISNN